MNNKRRFFLTGPRIIYCIVAAMFYMSFYTSCANMGNPEGGPKDSIPPVVLKSSPYQGELNVKEKQIEILFDEYVVLDGIYDKLVISPPVKKQPTLKMKGKSVILKFDESLKDSTTYSIDFKNSITDNNEGNILEEYRIGFSTGPTIDTLRIVGFVKNAFNLEPIENSYVYLYSNTSDTVATTITPDHIAKTNSEGFFMFDGLPQKKFQLYVVEDSNNDMKLDPRAEQHAFLDSLLYPTATFIPDSNIQISGVDTLLIYGQVRFQPNPIYLMQYEQEVFLQSLDDYKREKRKRFQLYFTESLTDSFEIKPVNFEPATDDWYYLEATSDMDSLDYWITDTLVSRLDTMEISIKYQVSDSLFNLATRIDTLEFLYEDVVVKNKEKRVRGQRKKKNIEEVEQTVAFTTNLKKDFDVYREIEITTPDPINGLSKSNLHLQQLIDTIYTDVEFDFNADSISKRIFRVNYNWEPEANYLFVIDSAATKTVYGTTLQGLEKKFNIQKEEHYGKIILTIDNVDGPVIVQLLSDSEDESVIYELSITESGVVTFPFLEPQKFKMKVIYDRNGNGKWDTGNFDDRLKPEDVIYYKEIIRIRSNFEYEKYWKLPRELNYQKSVLDPEAEAEKKKSERKAKRENMKAF